MGKRKVVHGALLKVLINDKEVGRMTGLNPSESDGLTAIRAIGDFNPRELLKLQFTGNFTASQLLVEKDKAEEAGLIATKGKSVGQVIKEILSDEGFNIGIENKYTKERIITITGAKIDSRGYSFSANAISIKNISGQFIEPIKVN